MIVSINQPAYLPWLGYFHRIAASDLHIVLDHVQFEKNSFTNRNRVLGGGGASWLTVPVLTSGRFGSLAIRELEIDQRQDWRTKHWRTITQAYRKTPHFAEHEPFFRTVYEQTWTHLAPLAETITDYLLRQFGVTTPLRLSSGLSPTNTKSELVLELCRKTGAAVYLSGALGRNYLDAAEFDRAGIEVIYQVYRHPRYAQDAADFVPNLAAIDLLFRHGPAAREILLEGQAPAARR